jgi:hypothetical protein
MHTKRKLSRRRGFGRADAIVCVCMVVLIGLIIGGLVMGYRKLERMDRQGGTMSQMRGIHQSMVISSQDNNGYLPGLDRTGAVLKGEDLKFGDLNKGPLPNAIAGGSISGRYYLLLKSSYIDENYLWHSLKPRAKTAWESGRLPSEEHYAFSLLRITDGPAATATGAQAKRAAEWTDHASDRAMLIVEENTGASSSSDKVRSVWSSGSGSGADWNGGVVWGDNHADFLHAPNARLGVLGLSTKYAGVVNSDDFLFGSADGPGKVGSASAMFGYLSEDF